MKKRKLFSLLLGVIVSLSFSASVFAKGSVDSNTQVNSNNSKLQISLKQGQEAKIPLIPINTQSTQNARDNLLLTSKAVFPGNGGYISLSPSGGRIYYKVVVGVPADSFTGHINTTDLTSGLSGGYNWVVKFSGSVPYSNYSKHRYSASLTGTAYLGPFPIAKTVPNTIVWTN